MIVGTEWLVEASKCSELKLRDEDILRGIFSHIIEDLSLSTLGRELWHKFPGEGGVTGLVPLTESHLACHTYPEYRIATFNLYCCKTRPEWNWEKQLIQALDAEIVNVTRIERGIDIVADERAEGASR